MLTKEEMFDFIVNNQVSISREKMAWTKHDDDGNIIERFIVDTYVCINGWSLGGMGLAEAIQYYVDNKEF